MRVLRSGIVSVLILGVHAATSSAADPVTVCNAGKLQTAAKYGSCRLIAEAKGVRKALTPDFSKCEATFSTKWQKAESKAGTGVCLSEMDEADIEQRIESHAETIATLLAGGAPAGCGNSIADGDEQCDGVDLGGQTCQGLGYTLGGTLSCTAGCSFDTSACDTERLPASGQTTSYGSGDDGDVEPGAILGYTDNADGTITDNNTGLMWEKKINVDGDQVDCSATEAGTCADPHDADNTYDWTDGPAGETAYDGGSVTIFLDQLNNRCNDDTAISCATNSDCLVPGGPCGFAGYRDWRLPGLRELQSIVHLEEAVPLYDVAVDLAFFGASCGLCSDITDPACSCTYPWGYWTSTTYNADPSLAWVVAFYDGETVGFGKSNPLHVRAVRRGN